MSGTDIWEKQILRRKGFERKKSLRQEYDQYIALQGFELYVWVK
jgi:hypothetical protein